MSAHEAFARPLWIPPDPVPGVNLVGFLEAESGLGEIARRLGRGLQHAEIPFSAISYRRTPSRLEGAPEFPISHDAPYDTNLVCLNADYLAELATDVGLNFFACRYSIGVWFMETDVLRSEHKSAFRYLDEVWVASEYVRRTLARETDLPVHVVPVPIEEPLEPTRSRSDLGLPDDFTFLFLFDFVSAERKNPMAVVEAFKRAFGPDDGASLVLKSINGQERKPDRLADLEAATAGRPDMTVLDGYVSAAERDSYIAACDCFVSLHRSEGLGLTMAEAMAYGKPVIATAYSGNLEFMDDANSYLVPYRLTPIPPEWWAYSPGAEWADPDAAVAAELMRRVYENQSEAQSRGARARADLIDRFSLERTESFLVERLEDMRLRRASTSAPVDAARRHVLEASRELERGVGGSLATGGRGPTALLRRALLRALWPYLAKRHRYDTAVVDTLDALQRSLVTLEQSVSELAESREGPGVPSEDQSASSTKNRQTSRA